MKTKAKQILCVLLLNSILLTAVFSAPAALANEKAFTESTTYSDASVSQSSASPPQRLVTNKKGEWIKASNGKYWYRHTDGSYTKNDWEYIDGSWYFFDANGWMLSSQWLKWNGDWYFLNPSGVMHTGWLKDNGKWYYLSSRGIMQTGWVKPDSYWYYLDSNGVMQTGWRKLNGSWYYFESNGKMKTGVFEQNKRIYRFKLTGELYNTEIRITRQQQLKTYWCWAASSAMTGKYGVESSITQRDIVIKYKGSDKNEGGNKYLIAFAIGYASDYTKHGKALEKLMSFDEAVALIDSNHPFVINMEWNSGGKHAVVCSGYNLDTKQIQIIDPWGNNETQYYSFDGICNGVYINGNRGHADSMVIY